MISNSYHLGAGWLDATGTEKSGPLKKELLYF
jgi:hypothetical protein